jgi:hypothetical protein
MKCLLQSSDLIPIRYIDARKALVLWLLGKVYITQEYDDTFIRSPSVSYKAPKEVVVLRHVKMPSKFYQVAPLNLKNLKRRDHICLYCGRGVDDLNSHEYMTMDHVIPRSRGGQNVWENVAFSCVTCNNKKGGKTPEEANMPLRKKLWVPRRWEL